MVILVVTTPSRQEFTTIRHTLFQRLLIGPGPRGRKSMELKGRKLRRWYVSVPAYHHVHSLRFAVYTRISKQLTEKTNIRIMKFSTVSGELEKISTGYNPASSGSSTCLTFFHEETGAIPRPSSEIRGDATRDSTPGIASTE